MINIITTISDNLYRQAAKTLFNHISDKSNSDHNILVFLSGGSSIKLYYQLSKWLAAKRDIRQRLAFAQVDERKFNKEQRTNNRQPSFAESDSATAGRQITDNGKDINAFQIKKTGLWDICQERKIPYYLISQEGSLEKAADEYNQRLEQLFEKYDYEIAILGIGEDGHTAGLLPGYQKKWDLPRFVAGYENNGKFKKRISLTPKALKGLDYTLVTALGAKKRKPIERLLKKDKDIDFDKYPVAIVRDMRVVDLFTDLKH